MTETITPNQERIEQLCLALESGRYQQSRGALKNALGNCCLGVACDVKDPTRWYKRDDRLIFAYLADGVDEVVCHDTDDDDEIMGGALDYMTHDVAAWYGFSEGDPTVSVECQCTQDGKNELGQVAPHPNCDCCGGTGRTNMLLTELNDEWRLNFKQIAKALRDTYLTSTSSEGDNDA
jgi:hypothetical protein